MPTPITTTSYASAMDPLLTPPGRPAPSGERAVAVVTRTPPGHPDRRVADHGASSDNCRNPRPLIKTTVDRHGRRAAGRHDRGVLRRARPATDSSSDPGPRQGAARVP